MDNGIIKLGLIGCGYMGNYYAHNISRADRVEIVVCCDPSEVKLEAFSLKWGIPETTTDWFRLLTERNKSGIDGIINCSVDSLHADVFQYCIEESIPLLSEKPPAIPLGLLRQLSLKRASRLLCHSVFFINFSKRCLPAVAEAVDFINKGGIGEILRFELHYRQGWLINNDFGDWRTESAWFWRLTDELSYYGVLGDLGSHLFDLAAMVGGGVETLNCMLNVHPKDPAELHGFKLNSPDDVVCSLKFKIGASAIVSATRAAPGDVDSLELIVSGTAGTVKVLPEKSKDSYSFFKYKADENKGRWETVKTRRTVKKHHETFLTVLNDLKSGAGLSEGYTSRDYHAPGLAEAVINQVLIDAAVKSSVRGNNISIDEFIMESLGDDWLWINRKK